MATQNQIDAFHQFASGQVKNGGAQLSMTELLDLWEAKNPPAAELAESAAAVRSALNDMENGDTGRPLEDVIEDLRKEHSLPSK